MYVVGAGGICEWAGINDGFANSVSYGTDGVEMRFRDLLIGGWRDLWMRGCFIRAALPNFPGKGFVTGNPVRRVSLISTEAAADPQSVMLLCSAGRRIARD
jgi:hypothetical protein